MFEWGFEAGEECRGWGRKQNENTLEMRVWRGGRQAQIIETFASREDHTAASAFVSVAGLSEFYGNSIELHMLLTYLQSHVHEP